MSTERPIFDSLDDVLRETGDMPVESSDSRAMQEVPAVSEPVDADHWEEDYLKTIEILNARSTRTEELPQTFKKPKRLRPQTVVGQTSETKTQLLQSQTLETESLNILDLTILNMTLPSDTRWRGFFKSEEKTAAMSQHEYVHSLDIAYDLGRKKPLELQRLSTQLTGPNAAAVIFDPSMRLLDPTAPDVRRLHQLIASTKRSIPGFLIVTALPDAFREDWSQIGLPGYDFTDINHRLLDLDHLDKPQDQVWLVGELARQVYLSRRRTS